jgi:hypothetical protein
VAGTFGKQGDVVDDSMTPGYRPYFLLISSSICFCRRPFTLV